MTRCKTATSLRERRSSVLGNHCDRQGCPDEEANERFRRGCTRTELSLFRDMQTSKYRNIDLLSLIRLCKMDRPAKQHVLGRRLLPVACVLGRNFVYTLLSYFSDFLITICANQRNEKFQASGLCKQPLKWLNPCRNNFLSALLITQDLGDYVCSTKFLRTCLNFMFLGDVGNAYTVTKVK